MSASPRQVEALRAVSYFAFLFAFCAAVLFFFNLHSQRLYRSPSYEFLGWISVYACLAAIGLVSAKRWGLLLLVPPLLFCGVFLPVMAVVQDPRISSLSYALPWVGLAAVLMVKMIRFWKALG